MVSIGKDVYIASEVIFMTHDGSYSWLSRKMGYTDKRTDKIGKIVVRDNCFIGSKAIIMHDVTIGNNCIIGMGAIVTRDVQDGTVAAGVPAKEICSTEDFIKKNSNKQIILVDGPQRISDSIMKKNINNILCTRNVNTIIWG